MGLSHTHCRLHHEGHRLACYLNRRVVPVPEEDKARCHTLHRHPGLRDLGGCSHRLGSRSEGTCLALQMDHGALHSDGLVGPLQEPAVETRA